MGISLEPGGFGVDLLGFEFFGGSVSHHPGVGHHFFGLDRSTMLHFGGFSFRRRTSPAYQFVGLRFRFFN